MRHNFAINLCGRHLFTSGGQAEPLPSAGEYVGRVTIEDNYCEYSARAAADTHEETVGPFIVRNNVFYNCQTGVSLLAADTPRSTAIRSSGVGMTEPACSPTSIPVNMAFPAYERANPATVIPANSQTNKIYSNTVVDAHSTGIYVSYCKNALVQDNILAGNGGNAGIRVVNDGTTIGAIHIERNVVSKYDINLNIQNPSANIIRTTNYML